MGETSALVILSSGMGPVGCLAAVAGGITTIGCMTRVRPGEGMGEALDREKKLVEQQAIADIFLHPIVGKPAPELPAIFPA